MPGTDAEERIRASLLRMLEDLPLDRITVKSLCGAAGVSRGTFYSRYDNLDDLVDSLMDEALREEPSPIPYRCNFRNGEQYNCPYGICDKIHARPEFAAIFFNESLTGRVIEKIASMSRDKYVDAITMQCDLTREDAESIFYFQLNGCLAVNKIVFRDRDQQWEHNRDLIAGFIQGGLERYSN